MTLQRKDPARLGAAGPRELSCLSGDDPRIIQDSHSAQARFAAIRRLRRQRLVERLHRLGPAPLGHFLTEIEAGAIIAEHLERYARIDPAFVRALGGDRYAPVLHVIQRERQKS
jgi:hypothetical protein